MITLFLIWFVVIITYAVLVPKSTSEITYASTPTARNTPQPEVIEKIVEITKIVVVTATPKPVIETPTPAVTLGTASEYVDLICFPGRMEKVALENYLTGQFELPIGAEIAEVLDSGYIFLEYVPNGGYEFCVFSYKLNRGDSEGLTLTLFNYGSDEALAAYPLQTSSLEEERAYVKVAHDTIVNPNGRWSGVAQLMGPEGRILLVNELGILGN
ncbi:MAG: hypothetical protein MAG431_00478 [Chloroflexi bacterium]|nr:hypothetical protein [Chloroflexota bacterium]